MATATKGRSQKITRADALANLVDIKTVAVRFGVPERTVQTWRYRSTSGRLNPPTPDEVKTVAQGVPLWWWADWVEWAEDSGRGIPNPDAEADYGDGE